MTRSPLTSTTRFLTAAAVALATAGCQSERDPADPPVTFLAAASTITALDEIARKFTAETGIPVQTSYAASSTLATMLHQQVDADLFLSASRDWATSVSEAQPGCRTIDLLGNRLVVVVPSGAAVIPSSLNDLAGPEFNKIAIGDPMAVPAGIYARQALERAGLWESIEPRLVGAIDVRQALTYVEQGAADCGFVYSSDARDNRNVRIAFSLEGHDPIVYPLVVLHGASPQSLRFVEHLQSDRARQVFEKYGFEFLPR